LLPDQKAPASLVPLVGGVIDTEHIAAHWDQLLPLATSIRTGTTTSSAVLKKLSAYPRQNGLAKALREMGRIERTLFTLDWIKNPDLRRRAHLGLNKGEACNALARGVYFCRLGEARDRSFENQFFRASGLNCWSRPSSFGTRSTRRWPTRGCGGRAGRSTRTCCGM